MRLFTLAICCAVLVTSFAEPEPKKYKSTLNKNKANNTLTVDEKDFLREVEAKFGIKSVKDKKDDTESNSSSGAKTSLSDVKLPFPAVIAIEIVNDTDTKTQGKGKRTIDANLGYGYKTNNGYSYSYFGKPFETQGKFMIYPYSQEDIPAPNGHTKITDIEITPSRAFELVQNINEGYHYQKPLSEFTTGHGDVKGIVSPPPAYPGNGNSHGSHGHLPSTLYTTYNGHELSGLSGNFPTVMPNYFVDSSQLLRNPEYQGAGLTDDHLRPHGSKIADQRVVPVLVLRIPSSSLKNPTAELFANLPSNYPLSRYLNNVNLQGLVNQYFKKHGYSFAPQVMHYQNSLLSPVNPAVNYARQHYATPHVQPSYTQSDHSGVQYSAVQPVMAKFPSSYTQKLNLPHGHALYHQPLHQQKHEYRYHYVPQHVKHHVAPQTYYVEPQYQQQTQEGESVLETAQHVTPAEGTYEHTSHVSAQHEHYEVPSQQSHETPEEDTGSYEFRAQAPQIQSHTAAQAAYEYLQQQQYQHQQAQQEQVESASPSYGHQQQQYQQQLQEQVESASPSYRHQQQQYQQQLQEQVESASPSYGHQQQQHQQQQQEQVESASPSYGHQQQQYQQQLQEHVESASPSYGHHGAEVSQVYYSQEGPQNKETKAMFHPHVGQKDQAHNQVETGVQYQYQQQSSEDANNLILTENYPSKDHTIATVLPVSYKANQPSVGVQTISYVTPMPYSSKYQSPYRIMVPQTSLINPSTEKVTYVNSHSVSAFTHPSQQEHNPEAEYTVGPHHIPPVGKQKPSYYPRNYHSHPKRMTKPDIKQESQMFRKPSDRNEKKKS